MIAFVHEPAYALAGRLARRNGVSSLASFGGDHHIRYTEIIKGRRNDEIARMAKAHLDAVNRATFTARDDNRVCLGSEMLHYDDWSYGHLRVCPDCLKADIRDGMGDPAFRAHIRSWWNLTFLEVCPSHKIVMLDRDPARPMRRIDPRCLDVRFSAGSQCDFTSDQIPRARVENADAERYILGRLGFMTRVSAPVLDDLPLWNAIRVMDRFGAVAAGGPGAYTALGGSVSQREALSAGYKLFKDGKPSLFQFLDSLVAIAKVKNGKWGARRVYGRIYKWLGHDTRDPVYDPLRELVREHIKDNLPLDPNEDVFGKPFGTQRVCTIWHASKEIGQHHDMLRRTLVSLGRLTIDDAKKPNSHILLRSGDITEVKALLCDRLTFREAREYLGLPRGPMQGIFNAGLLPPFLSTETGVSEYVFRRRDLDKLLKQLLGAAFRPCKGDDLVNIVQAGRRGLTSSAEVIKLMLSGKLKCAARDPRAAGLMQILVKLSDVKALRPIHENTGISLEQGWRILGVTHPVLRALVDHGYLTTELIQRRGRRKQELIDPGSFEDFRRTYISATDVAQSRQTHVRSLVQRLKGSRVNPAIEKSTVGQYFYRRSQLEPVWGRTDLVN